MNKKEIKKKVQNIQSKFEWISKKDRMIIRKQMDVIQKKIKSDQPIILDLSEVRPKVKKRLTQIIFGYCHIQDIKVEMIKEDIYIIESKTEIKTSILYRKI